MTRRSKTSSSGAVVAALALAAVAAGAFWVWRHADSPWNAQSLREPPGSTPVAPASPSTPSSTSIAIDRVDAANEGRLVSVEGRVRAGASIRDPELGLGVDALVLLRRVEMLQWQERCAKAGCDYSLAWSAEPVDSSAFRVRQGHENPRRLPFQGTRVAAATLRLGAFDVDPLLVDTAASIAYAVTTAQLPPNLAATFREHDGALYSGSDPAHGVAGDVRVTYRVVPAGDRRLTAIQRGHRLVAPPTAAAPGAPRARE